jgi:hypothetical protein
MDALNHEGLKIVAVPPLPADWAAVMVVLPLIEGHADPFRQWQFIRALAQDPAALLTATQEQRKRQGRKTDQTETMSELGSEPFRPSP